MVVFHFIRCSGMQCAAHAVHMQRTCSGPKKASFIRASCYKHSACSISPFAFASALLPPELYVVDVAGLGALFFPRRNRRGSFQESGMDMSRRDGSLSVIMVSEVFFERIFVQPECHSSAKVLFW